MNFYKYELYVNKEKKTAFKPHLIDNKKKLIKFLLLNVINSFSYKI